MRLALAWAYLLLMMGAAAADELPAGFVYLRAVDPTIAQDIRYAGTENFVGAPLPGYQARECILLTGAAEALRQVQVDLVAVGYGLKVFDCYRPARAVKAMAGWAADGKPAGASRRFFPNLDKANLHSLGYIARRSTHSTGTAVDLTLVRIGVPAGDGASGTGLCTGAASERSSSEEVDMGTGYDCLDPKGHTASTAVGIEQQQARRFFIAAMKKRGFSNYAKEWWHFTWTLAGRQPAKDFPIVAPSAR
jgi:zinc D-Ala-D-Ala dipeptidase